VKSFQFSLAPYIPQPHLHKSEGNEKKQRYELRNLCAFHDVLFNLSFNEQVSSEQVETTLMQCYAYLIFWGTSAISVKNICY
jgi:hypothetical protein